MNIGLICLLHVGGRSCINTKLKPSVHKQAQNNSTFKTILFSSRIQTCSSGMQEAAKPFLKQIPYDPVGEIIEPLLNSQTLTNP